MNYFSGNFSTNGITCNRAITGIGFQPSYLRFTLSQKTTTSEAFVHFSEGFTDGTSQSCHSLYWDSTGGQSKQFTDKVINHVNRVGGTLTDVIKATFVSFDADGLTLNFSTTTSGYRVHVEAFE